MNELDKRILAGRVKDLRLALGETHRQFADRLGVSLSSVSSYELAILRPSYGVTLKLYQAATNLATTSSDVRKYLEEQGLRAYFKDRLEGMFQAGYAQEPK